MLRLRTVSRRAVVWAAAGLVLLLSRTGHASDSAPTGAAGAAPTHVRFLLRSECSCSSCGFALQQQLRKAPGIARVDISARERTVAVAFDEERLPVSRLAALVASTELGKHSALIGDLTGSRPSADLAARARVEGVRAVAVDQKKHRLLIELADDAAITTAGLTAALAKAEIVVRFDNAAAGGPPARAASRP
jgi:copper chaperone CopZ